MRRTAEADGPFKGHAACRGPLAPHVYRQGAELWSAVSKVCLESWPSERSKGMPPVGTSFVVSNRRPGSAGALLKRVSVRCSDRPEKANGQPGMFCTTRLAEDRWQRHVYRQGSELWGKFWERHVYRQRAVALVSESVAQASVRALLRPTREGQRSTRLVRKGMFGIAVLAIPFGMLAC